MNRKNKTCSNEQKAPLSKGSDCAQKDLRRQQRIKNLQKKKDAGPVNPNIEAFVVDVIYGEKWKADHLDRFSSEERTMYQGFLECALNVLAGDDRDRFIDRIENVLNEPTRNNIWEVEHVHIENALDKLTREKNRLATRFEIADKTGYSQETIGKHVQEYFTSPYFKKRQEDIQLLRENLLSRCYAFGVSGDMKAARLFLEATAHQKPVTSIQHQQNNFIQVNSLTITQEQINGLPEDKREQMKEIVTLLKSQRG